MGSFISLPPTSSPLGFISTVGVFPSWEETTQITKESIPSRERVSDADTASSRITLIRALTGQTDTAAGPFLFSNLR